MPSLAGVPHRDSPARAATHQELPSPGERAEACWPGVIIRPRNSSHPGVRIWATGGTGALGRKDPGHSRVQIKVDALIGGHLTIQGPQWMTRLPEIPAQKLSILKT